MSSGQDYCEVAFSEDPSIYVTYNETYYAEPDGEGEIENSALVGIAVAVLTFITIVGMCAQEALGAASGATGPFFVRALDRIPGPAKGIQNGLYWWGGTLVRKRAIISALVFIFLAVISGVGLPMIEVKESDHLQWSPSGGRFEKQLKWVDEYVDSSVNDRQDIFVFMSAKEKGTNMLAEPEYYLTIFESMLRRLHAETAIEYKGTPIVWRDVCLNIQHPLINSLISVPPYRLPCVFPSPLDAFYEGTWFYEDQVATGEFASLMTVGILATSQGLPDQLTDTTANPSYKGMPTEDIIDRLSCKAKHWLTAGSQVKEKLFGNVVMEDDGRLVSAETFAFRAFHAQPAELVTNETSSTWYGFSADEILEADADFLLALEDKCEELSSDPDYVDVVEINVYPKNALDRMYKDIESGQIKWTVIGYVLMFVFVVISQSFTLKFINNLFFPAVFGYVLVVIANASAYGLLGILFDGIDDLQFNYTMTQALPIIAIGLGVNDLFLVLHNFGKQIVKGGSAEEIIARTMEEAGSSVTVTSGCNMGVFLVCSYIPIPALRAFMVGVAVVVFMNYVVAMTLIPIVCSIWVSFVKKRLPDLTPAQALPAPAFGDAPPAFGAEGKRESELEREMKTATEIISDVVSGRPQEGGVVDTAVGQFYGSFSSNFLVKGTALAIGITFVAWLNAMHGQVEKGYKYTDLAREGTYLAKGIEIVYDQIYSQHEFSMIIFGPGIDYPEEYPKLQDVHLHLKQSRWSLPQAIGLNDQSWFDIMTRTEGLCEATRQNADNVTVCDFWYENFHLWRIKDTLLCGSNWQEHMLADQCANMTSTAEVCSTGGSLDNCTGTVLSATPACPSAQCAAGACPSFGSLIAEVAKRTTMWGYEEGKDVYCADNELILSFDEVQLNVKAIKNTNDQIKMVKEWKAICQEGPVSHLYIYPHGWLYTTTEQFINLDDYFWLCASISMYVIYVFALCFGLSWLGALLTTLFSIAMFGQLYGLLAVFDIEFQPLSAVSILMSLGFAVEFTAHSIAAFEYADGSRDDRLAEAYRRTAIPVLEGGFSSFLSFVIFAAYDFPFVRKYFFQVYCNVVLMGYINGLILLPAILGLLPRSVKVSSSSTAAVDLPTSVTSPSTSASA